MTIRHAADRCWLCGQRHALVEFRKVDRVPITWGYMPPKCRAVFDALPRERREKLRAAGLARYDAKHAATA